VRHLAVYLGIALLTGVIFAIYAGLSSYFGARLFGVVGFTMIGIISGFFAEKVVRSSASTLTNVLAGIAGAFIGGLFANLFDLQLFTHFIFAAGGAVLLLWLLRAGTSSTQ
jgi:uncharacterized membrane protein YeaQ/YmgE (transglycosylase-associated protein family)